METIQQGMSREARIAASLAAAQRNHPLAGLGFAGLGMPAVNMINPWCPLHFERVPGGQVQDSKYDSEVNNPLMAPMDPYMMMGRHLSIAGFFASPVEYKAFQLAAEALTASPDKRIPMAEEALRLSPHCAEAYNVLAMYKAKDFEEALEYYKKGAELGPRAFEQERWEEQVEQQDLHDVLPYRSVLRSAYGVANTLRKMKRGQEAYEAWQVLFQYNREWHGSSSTWCNVFAYYPEVLIRAKGPAAALEWMNSWEDTTDYLIYSSCSLLWTTAYVLCQAATQPGKYFVDLTLDDKISVDNFKKGVGTLHLVTSSPDLVDMLLGDVPLPAGRIPSMIGGSTSTAAPVMAAAAFKDLWQSLPGAAPHLRRCRNTTEVRYLACDLRRRLGGDMDEFRRFLEDGIYVDAVIIMPDGTGNSLLEEFVFAAVDGTHNPEWSPKEVQALRGLLEAGCPVVRPPAARKYRRYAETMLTYSTYQGHGPKVTELLLQAGADPAELNPRGSNALEMGANQGSWRELHVLLRTHPDLPQRLGKPPPDPRMGYDPSNMLEVMLFNAFGSSCHACIDSGGRRRCMRCSYGVLHPAAASFYSTLDVLLAHGLKLSSKLTKAVEQLVVSNGGGPYKKLLAHLKKSAAAGITSAQLDERMAAQAPAADKDARQSSGSRSSSSSTSARNDVQSLVDQLNAMGHHQHGGGCGSGCTHSHHHHHQAPQPPEASASLAAAKQRPKACWACSTATGKLSRCAGCSVAYFCSKDCQKQHWGVHKADCKAWKALQAAEAPLGGAKS